MYRRFATLFVLFTALFLLPQASFAQINVKGMLLGADGHPMEMAHIVVELGPTDTTVIAQADQYGRFALSLDHPGGYGMYAIGLHHETLIVPLILTGYEDVDLQIRLSTHGSYLDADSLFVVTPELEAPELMQRREDGTFATRIKASSDTLAYRIRYGSPASEWSSARVGAGHIQDRFVFDRSGTFWDSEGDYYSVSDVVAGQETEIVFDPTRIPRHSRMPSMGSQPSEIAQIANIYLDSERKMRGSGNLASLLLAANRVRSQIKKQLRREANPVVRHWLKLRYFDVRSPMLGGKRLARKALRSIPADSPLWTYEAWSATGASKLMFELTRKAKDDDLVADYVQRVLDTHPATSVRVHFLYFGINWAHYLEDEETKWKYYSMLQYSHPDTRQAEWVRRKFDPDRKLQAGNPVPEFSFVSFDDPNVTITDRGLRGRIYLLDFWGTWCAPCIKEIPDLERVYADYHERGFEILSVSMRDDRADVVEFREDRYPMPWMHAWVSRQEDGKVRKLFEIKGFPRPVLVDTTGIIVAIDNQLLSGRLEDAVKAAFGDVD